MISVGFSAGMNCSSEQLLVPQCCNTFEGLVVLLLNSKLPIERLVESTSWNLIRFCCKTAFAVRMNSLTRLLSSVPAVAPHRTILTCPWQGVLISSCESVALKSPCSYSSPTVLLPSSLGSPAVLLPCSYRAPTVLLPCSYRAPTVLHPCSYRTPTVLLPCSYRTPTVLLPCSIRAPTVLLPFSHRAPSVLLPFSYALW